ncbi:MAG: DedA family protein [bacterium]
MNIPSTLPDKIKNWFERFAHNPFASPVLFALAFIESSLFPIAPDFLFIPLSVIRPRRALLYAAICVAGSTLGALAGYYIGFGLFEMLGEKTLAFFGWTEVFQTVLANYRANAWSTLLLAGFTPIPFQVFALAAGFRQTIDIGTFALAVLAGRSLRFFFLGGLLFLFGERIKKLLDKHMGWVTAAVLILIILWMLAGRTF